MAKCTRGLRTLQTPIVGWVIAAVLWCLASVAQGSTIQAAEAEVGTMLAGLHDRDLGDGVHLDGIVARAHQVELDLARNGRRVARIFLFHPGRPGRRVGGFSVALQTSFSQARTPEERAVVDAVELVLGRVESYDPEVGQQLAAPAPRPWLRGGLSKFRWIPAAIFALFLLGWTRTDRLQLLVRPNHAVPAAIQTTLYSYWWLYTQPVGSRFVDIAAQVAFAYAFEALLRWSRGKTWRVTLGPLPIVFSTNLFVWFIEPWLQCTAIGIALVSKELVHRGGRHIFNPSALAVTLLAIATLAMPATFTWGTPTPDVEMNLPPNMAELMLILTVIAQLRFPIVLVPMSACAGIMFAATLGWNPPNPFWPATFLIILLFATDPKTLPTTTSGRVLYGLCLGLSLSGLSRVLSLQGLPDTYAKVIPIPFLNYLAPWLDQLGETLYDKWRSIIAADHSELRTAVGNLLEPRYNRLHVAVWVVVAVFSISTYKAGSFQTLAHWEYDTPHVQSASLVSFPTCEENPVWCQPFSFAGEARLWLDRVETPSEEMFTR